MYNKGENLNSLYHVHGYHPLIYGTILAENFGVAGLQKKIMAKLAEVKEFKYLRLKIQTRSCNFDSGPLLVSGPTKFLITSEKVTMTYTERHDM